jgi:hypothetical protein
LNGTDNRKLWMTAALEKKWLQSADVHHSVWPGTNVMIF